MKISIITVTYNAANVLEPTILSVIAQDYPHIEYIIVDGNSSDNTIDIIKKYEKHISKWISEPDQGLYDAMNKGLQMATGDYVMFLNAGDRLAYPTVLSEVFQQCGGADFIYGGVLRVDEKGYYRPWHKRYPLPEKLSYKSFLKGMVICHQTMIVKRQLAPMYDLRWQLSADIDWSIRLMKQVKTKCYFNNVLVYFQMGGVSARRRKQAWKERWQLLQKHFGFFPTLWVHLHFLFAAIKRWLTGKSFSSA